MVAAIGSNQPLFSMIDNAQIPTYNSMQLYVNTQYSKIIRMNTDIIYIVCCAQLCIALQQQCGKFQFANLSGDYESCFPILIPHGKNLRMGSTNAIEITSFFASIFAP